MKTWQKRTLIGFASFLALTVVAGIAAGPSDEASPPVAEPSIVEESQTQNQPVESEAEPEETADPTSPEDEVSNEESPTLSSGDTSSSGASSSSQGFGTSWDELLGLLTVEPEFQGGYQRTYFRHWIDASGNGCDARREVLIRQSLTPVTVGPRCAISGGTWYSEFDGVTTTDASSFDIDHLVPLKEAWESGAHAWDEPTRRAFANDLELVDSLIAVSASSNRSKGDRDPAQWMPPRTEYHCQYIASWVRVKVKWQLTVDSAEKASIRRTASSCGTAVLAGPVPSLAPVRVQPGASPTPTTSPTPTASSTASPSPSPTASPSPSPTASPSPTPTAAPAPSSKCQANQVDINTAGIADLERIIHIGSARAPLVVEARSVRRFTSVDELTRINGIGPSRLADIKAEGLACAS